MRKSLIATAAAVLVASLSAPGHAEVSLDGGYTSLNVRGLNSDQDTLKAFMVGAPFQVYFISNKMENGYFVSLGDTMDGSRFHPGFKLEFIQSETAHLHDEFFFFFGHSIYDQQDTVSLLPVMLGFSPELWSAGGAYVTGSLHAGYAAAMDEHAIYKQNLPPIWHGRNGLQQAFGGGFVAEAELKAGYRLSSRVSLNCNGGYRLAEMGNLYDASKAPVVGWTGATVGFDMSGFNFGGGITYGF
jgi:hypothetical protein